MRSFGCEAQIRPSHRKVGWVCHGEHLTVLLVGPGSIPCVLPDAMVPDAMTDRCASAYDPQPFTGGDHYHLQAPEIWACA